MPAKYLNKKTNGYASKKEAKRAVELMVLERSGQIRNLREQVRYGLLPSQRLDGKSIERPVFYVADFVYEEQSNGKWQSVVEDCKGAKTREYIIKRKLMLHVHGIRIRES